MTTTIACLIAVISTTGFLALWFWIVHKELSTKRNMAVSAETQVTACRNNAAQIQIDIEKQKMQEVLKRSLDIYVQAIRLYNNSLRLPWNYIPGKLMGFHQIKEEAL